MNWEEIYEFLNSAVLAKESRTLTKAEKTILAGAWQDETYESIAQHSREYSINYLKRDVGPKLWKLLTAIFHKDINKKNLRTVLLQIISSTNSQPLGLQKLRFSHSELHSEKTQTKPSQDLGEAVDVAEFFGRESELNKLQQWILSEQKRSRIIALLGVGGIGKTSLAVKLVKHVQDQFDYVVWRSLQQAPLLEELLIDLVTFLSGNEPAKPAADHENWMTQLMNYLHQHRCLLIFDNIESLFQPGRRAGRYRDGYEKYGELIKRVGEEAHQSCLVVVGREKPAEVALMEGEKLFVRSLSLGGLSMTAARKLIQVKGFSIAEEDESYDDLLSEESQQWNELIKHYGGNPLAIKVASTAIYELFNSDISAFLSQNKTLFDNIHNLIEEQIDRLHPSERIIINWLAISYRSTSFSELQDDILAPDVKRKFLGLLKSLKDRSLVEIDQLGFTLQPVIREYLIEKLIECFFDNIVNIEVNAEARNKDLELNQYALIKTQAEDHVIQLQLLSLIRPLLTKLLVQYNSEEAVEQQLRSVISQLQHKPRMNMGYAGGNVINLLRELGTNFAHTDLSNLTLWQARLHGLNLRHVNLKNSDLGRSTFVETAGHLFPASCSPHEKFVAQSTFTETIGDVLSVSFSVNGEFVAAGDTEGKIHVWQFLADSHTLIKYRSWRGHDSWIRSIAFSPDHQTLLSGSNDYTVKLWDIHTGQCLRTIRSKDWIRSVQFNPDGQTFVTGGDDYLVKLWSISPDQPPITFLGDAHLDRVRCVAFSPDGKRIASAGDDYIVIVWDIAKQRCMARLEGHTARIRSVAISPDGQLVASGGDDHTVRVWEISSQEPKGVFKQHTDRVRAIGFSSDGRYLVSGSDDCTMRIWDLTNNTSVTTLGEDAVKRMERVQSIAFNPNSPILVSGHDNQTLKLWNIDRQTCIKTLKGATNGLQAICFVDNDTLISGSDDQTIQIWQLQEHRPAQILVGHTGRITTLALATPSETGMRVLASGSDDCTVRLWDVNTGQWLQTLPISTHWIRAVAFSPDGKILAAAGDDQLIRLWAVHAGRVPPGVHPTVLKGHQHWIRTIAFSPDGQKLASGGDDQMAMLWDVQTGQQLRQFNKHDHRIRSVAFSPDSKLLVSGSDDATIRLWDVATGHLIHRLQVDSNELDSSNGIKSVAFSPDGQILASSSDGVTIRLWDIPSGSYRSSLQGHEMGVQSIAFSPDGNTLASSSRDGELKLWDLGTGACRASFQVQGPYAGMNITGVKGLTAAQKISLLELGAIEEQGR